MAEANAQGQPNPQGANGQAPAADGQPNGAQSQEPAWFAHVPEQFKEEAKKGWMQEADYRKKTMELADQRKQFESEQQKYKDIEQKYGAYDQWWKQNEATFNVIQKNWDKIAPILQGQAANGNPQGPAVPDNGHQPNHFDNFDILPPEEQAKRIADYVMNQQVNQGFTSLEQKLNQVISQKEAALMNYLAILTDAYGRKFQDPSLDIPQYIQKATEFSYGKFNPMDLAYHSMTDAQKLEKMKEEWLAAGREEGKREAMNQIQSPGAFNNPAVPNFKAKPKTAAEVKNAVRELAISKGFGW